MTDRGRPAGGPAITHIPDEEIGGPADPRPHRADAQALPDQDGVRRGGRRRLGGTLLDRPVLHQGGVRQGAVPDRRKRRRPQPAGLARRALCAIPVVTALIGIAQNWLTSTIGNSAMADLRSDLFAHLQKMELAFFTATKTGAIQSRLANDVAGVRTVLTDTATSILQNSVTVTAAFISMVILSWQLTLLTLVVMPLFVWIQLQVGKRRQKLARRRRSRCRR